MVRARDTDTTAAAELAGEGNPGRTLLLEAMGRHKVGIGLGMVLGVVWSLAKLAVPILVGRAIDEGIRGGGSLVGWTLAIVGAGIVSALATGLRRYVAFRNARLVEAETRDRLYVHAQKLHFGFHDRYQTGQLMSRGNVDLQHFQNFITMLPITVANVLTVSVAAVILLVLDPVLAFFALVSLPLANFFGRRFATRLMPAVLGIQEESAQLASVVEETVGGIRVVKGFGAEQVRADALAKEADDVYDRGMEAASARATYLPGLEAVPSIGLILVLFVGGHRVIDGHLQLGELVTFNIYVLMLIQPLRMLGFIVAGYQRARTAGSRIHSVLATRPEIVDPVHPVHLPPPEPGYPVGRVEFSHVNFSYEPGSPPVLSDLDLVIEPGESVAIVGETGSGKSTISRLLPRFYEIDSGCIRLDGCDITRLRLGELRRAVGIVFEETFLFSASIRDNIAFALPDASDEVVERAARLAGAHEFIVELPEGYDTEIGERGFSLSGGQRQRISIARAIVSDPRVLILDDATSAVDPTKEHEIRDAMAEVMAGRTTIVIAHRVATIALADRVVLLDEGRIVAAGTHTELLDGSPRYREVLAAEAEGSGAGVGA